ncbi:MAG: hypothetical protein ACO3XO_03760 [Bdellovibrionota bacterium]
MTPPRFYRKAIKLRRVDRFGETLTTSPESRPRALPLQETSREKPQQVLVINESAEMAGAITRQLLYTLPNASIMYSPTLELASWILKSREINLVISSEILPDGGPQKIQSILRTLKHPPDMLIVGRSVGTSITHLSNAGYHLVQRKQLAPTPLAEAPVRSDLPRKTPPIEQRVSTLGADLRNDLNNPLQEIVTMAFVARQSDNQRELSDSALEAIERAARQLAGTVEGLEDRIRAAVG